MAYEHESVSAENEAPSSSSRLRALVGWRPKSDSKQDLSPELSPPTSETEGVIVAGNYAKRWRYNSPLIQVLLVSMCAFGCPGMYNALSGLGGGGQLDTYAASTGNIALSAISSASYLFIAPIVYHFLGPRWCIFIGGITYPLYGGSLLAYNHISSSGFVIATSAILGLGSTFFWVAQGAIITSYPLAAEKGRFLGMFWFVFNMGGVIGSFISLGVNFDSASGSVSDATYGAFIGIMFVGFMLGLGLRSPTKVIREDGSRVNVEATRPNIIKEFIEIVKIIPRKESLVMIPFFFSANYFYSYQQNTVNARLFDIRTRSLNGAMYWLAQMVTAILFGLLLDNKRMSRRLRGRIAFGIVCVLSLIIWGGGLAFQLRSAPSSTDKHHHYYGPHELDLVDSHTKFAGPFVLYFAYGVFDSLWQNLAYWLIGCMGSEDLENADSILARYVGLYKSMQGVGGAIAWKVNSISANYDLEFALNWGFLSVSLIVLTPIFWWIREPPTLDSGNIDEVEGREVGGDADLEPALTDLDEKRP